jgi:type II secretory pathway component PulK
VKTGIKSEHVQESWRHASLAPSKPASTWAARCRLTGKQDARLHNLGPAEQRGSVLIIVLWVSFGLVTLALYFANSMSFELRASDNRAAAREAEQAIAGAARYVSNVLARAEEPATMPDLRTYRAEAVPVGDAMFWLLGRSDRQSVLDVPTFGLVDEASKLNVNTATLEMLEALPRMTPELAAAIIDWRDSDSNVTSSTGAEDETYQRRTPAYRCKNGKFESVDELRLVMGAYLDVLYGEDANLNGILDPNENDGDVSPPSDNRDGQLDSGILDYLTVYTREPNIRSDGSNRVNVASLNGANRTQLQSLLQNAGIASANQVIARVQTPAVRSVLEFYIRSQLSEDDFAEIETSLTVTNGQYTEGLVNVNTASESVLACIPGIGTDHAASLVAYRLSNPDRLNSLAWVKGVLEQANAVQAGPYLTGHTYQFTADVAALGHHGRGFRRAKFVFDLSEGTPQIRYRQDLSDLGWALGRETRQALLLAREIR